MERASYGGRTRHPSLFLRISLTTGARGRMLQSARRWLVGGGGSCKHHQPALHKITHNNAGW
ncbi:hypothetical protein C1H46_039187 [Malus baccata]|uniref:Uncharacterized protein n=1 Tax=Malus baccata TaxID=106549 RepID=A0A540KM21_MALBA|nr:hypothetical protein C1H46_039187 [Malus baccata]